MHKIKGWTTWAKVSPIHIILVESEVIVDLDGEVQDSVYIFLGPQPQRPHQWGLRILIASS